MPGIPLLQHLSPPGWLSNMTSISSDADAPLAAIPQKHSTSFLPSLYIPAAMIKLWPSTPLDQLTPRAGPNGQERNPFDNISPPSPTSPGQTTPSSSYHHHLLHKHPSYVSALSTASANGTGGTPKPADLTPLASPSLGNFVAALPTTHLSLHAPDFNMQQPPTSSRKALSNIPSASPASPSSKSSSSVSSAAGTGGPSKGQIHVKLIQARGLNVLSIHARPYVVVQFEQNEFVSRDPTDETDKEVKGTATNLARNGSSTAVSALGAIGSKAALALDMAARKDSANNSPSSSVSSGKSTPATTATSGPSSGLLFNRLSAHNPVWKHEVSL